MAKLKSKVPAFTDSFQAIENKSFSKKHKGKKFGLNQKTSIKSFKKKSILKIKQNGIKDSKQKKVHFLFGRRKNNEEKNGTNTAAHFEKKANFAPSGNEKPKGKRFKLLKPKENVGDIKSVLSEKAAEGNIHLVKKRKKVGSGDKSAAKKPKLVELKKKERKLLRKKQKNKEAFERSQELKKLWEELRNDKCEPDRKTQLLSECMRLIKGHAKEIIFAHDTVRVIECVFGLGDKEQQQQLFEELKDSIIGLSKSMYGKFFVIKVLRHGSKEQKTFVIKKLYGKVINLICHTESASVVEVAFNECANATQRSELVQEFYAPDYRFFKSSECHSLNQLFASHADKKPSVIGHMKEALSRILQKTVIRHSIVHNVLKEFMDHADQQPRSEIIELVRPVIVEMLHTKEGSRAAMQCLWHGTAKDRKAIIKSFKSHVAKVAVEEHGHMVLLALFDCVDDTKLVAKYIISELIADISEISQNLYGRKVLLYLVCPRDSVHFHPDVIKILQKGDNNVHSKKDTEVRRAELKKHIVGPLVKLVANYMPERYSDNAFCLFTLSILKHSAGHAIEAYRSVAKLTSAIYTNDVKNTHIIESSGSSFMLSKLVMQDKKVEEREDNCFTDVLIHEVPVEALQSWTLCNRGCFLLVNILETGIIAAVQKIKDAMSGLHKKISKRPFVGANVLLKKLK